MAVLLGTALVVVAGGLYVLLNTGPGNELLLRVALDQIDERIDGRITAEGISSPGLLGGATLHRVEITDLEGRPFLRADSVQARYAYRGLLRQDISLSSVEVWGPEVTVERRSGEDLTNVEQIFRLTEREPEPTEEDPVLRVMLRDVGLHGGTLLTRLPVEGEDPDPRFRTEVDPGDGALYQTYTLRELEGRFSEASIIEPGREGELIQVERLSFLAEVVEESFRIQEFRGVIHRDAGGATFVAERLWFPESEAVGVMRVEWSEDLWLEADLLVDVLELGDFRWAEPRLPDGRGSLAVRLQGPLDRMEVRIRDLDLQTRGSVIRGTVGVDLFDELRLAETALDLAPLHLDLLDPWIEDPLPLRGFLRGHVELEGPLRALRSEGTLSHEDPATGIPASQADFSGTLHLDEPFGVTGFALVLDPFRFELIGELVPGFPLEGPGSARLDASGRLGRGVRFTADVSHDPQGLAPSRIRALGTVEGTREELRLDIEGTLAPLSLDAVAQYRPDIPVAGEVSGALRVVGPLRDLVVESDLSTSAGPLRVRARFDAHDPGSQYLVDLETEDFRLSEVWRDAPSPTVVTGGVQIDGRGREVGSLEGEARAELRRSRAGEVEVERADLHVHAVDGVLEVSRFLLDASVIQAEGEGSFALRAGVPEGELVVRWETPSLASLRPVFLGEDPIAQDTLTVLEQEILRVQDVNPDTLPLRAQVDVDGRASGEVVLRGGWEEFTAEGHAEVVAGYWTGHQVERIEASFTAWDLPNDPWEVEADVQVTDAVLAGRSLSSAEGWVRYRSDRSGEGRISLHPAIEEGHFFAGSFQLDSVGGEANLEEVRLRFDDTEWSLQEPTRLAWMPRSVELDELHLASSGDGPMELRARGLLPFESGEADFHLELEGMDLGRLARLAQSDVDLAGTLDFTLDVGGSAESPIMAGRAALADVYFDGIAVAGLDMGFGYRDRILTGSGEALFEGRQLLSVSGSFPADFAFHGVEDRFPDRALDLRVRADDVPAAAVLGFLEVLEDLEGTLDGDIQVGGTPRNPEPTGRIRLRDGAFGLPELGLRPSSVTADLDVGADRVIRVTGEAWSRGHARIDGTITLEDVADPSFDLRVEAANFQAVDRRDLTVRLGGEIALEGRYTRPLVSGSVRVEQGTLFLEEFARTAEVVDLTDPAFFDVVDTTVVADQRVFVPTENPFLRNLRVGVDVDVQRDLWLRGREMNVEVAGELIVTYDRPQRELLLVGTLEPVRGAYAVAGRNFQVQDGTVEFVGTPGLNPSLDIRAVNRLRREGGEPLDILATVEGTLESPRVHLSSDAQPPIAESDLISYLIFGRPSHALGAGETSILQGAAGAGVTLGLGTLATQLGTAVAQQVGFDYFAITQARNTPGMGSPLGLAGAFAETQIEVGQYVGPNLFLALVLRPLTGLGTTSQTQVPGARIEWRFADFWMMEGVVEDRFSREGALGFGELGMRLSKVGGLSVFREWGW